MGDEGKRAVKAGHRMTLIPDRQRNSRLGTPDIDWECFRKGDRETICLLHGLAMDATSWFTTLPALAEFNIMLSDYTGQGRSTTRDEPCGIDTLAHAMAAVPEEVGIEKVPTMGVQGTFMRAKRTDFALTGNLGASA